MIGRGTKTTIGQLFNSKVKFKIIINYMVNIRIIIQWRLKWNILNIYKG
jgi:hypothetical protein